MSSQGHTKVQRFRKKKKNIQLRWCHRGTHQVVAQRGPTQPSHKEVYSTDYSMSSLMVGLSFNSATSLHQSELLKLVGEGRDLKSKKAFDGQGPSELCSEGQPRQQAQALA